MENNVHAKASSIIAAAALVSALGPNVARAAGAAETQFEYSVLFGSGDPAPDKDPVSGLPETLGLGFEPWALNDAGQVAFDVETKPSGAVGAFRYDHGKLIEIARTGQVPPSAGSNPSASTFYFPTTMTMNQHGDVSFTEFLLPSQSPPTGKGLGVYLYSSRAQTLRAVMESGVSQTPDGGVFAGAYYHDDLNDRGQVSFSGIFPTTHGIAGNPSGLGTGLFRADPDGSIHALTIPGDAAPGGGTFDFIYNGTINDRGDAAFGGHIAGEECIGNTPTSPKVIHCGTGVYLRRANGQIVTVVHPGDPAPGGGPFRQAYNANVDPWGNVAFLGDLTPASGTPQTDVGVFLYIAATRKNIALVRPGDALPGGGHLSPAVGGVAGVQFAFNSRHINALGQVTFAAILDTVTNGVHDDGFYIWSFGAVRLVARSGMVLPGIGTIAHVIDGGIFPTLGLNNLGQMALRARLTDGRAVVLLVSPRATAF